MTASPPPEASSIAGVLLHPDRPALFLVPQEAAWTLPAVQQEGRVWPPMVEGLPALLSEALGLPVTIVRCVGTRTAEGSASHHAVLYVLEGHGPLTALPAAGHWVGPTEMAAVPLAHPWQRAMLDACLAEAETGQISPLRPPWARFGWYDEATAWIAEQLARRGAHLLHPPEQIRTWGLSCILRARTTRGLVYFKEAAALPLFGDEPALMEGLARLYPRHVPAPLACAPLRRWMLLADVGPSLRERAGPEGATHWLEVFAALQTNAVTQVEALLGLGCLDRRLEKLATQIGPLLADEDALGGLDAQDIATLRALEPRLVALCRQLTTYEIPATLVHGDLHEGNIARRGEEYLFFDWTDACVAHPFMDLLTVRGFATSPDEQTAGWASLLERYLARWTAYAPLERLHAAWAVAEPLAYLHHAISYQHIVRALEPATKDDLSEALPALLRGVLRWASDREPGDREQV